MIKVERLSKPEELTTEVQNKLIEEFKKIRKKVYGINLILEINFY
ncbi:MAG: hypothetical protein ACLT61_07190 [Anaerostipes hadrus]